MRGLTVAALGIVFSFMICIGVSSAQTLYVSESLEITLRSGPGNDYRIIAMLPSATRLQLTESGGEWHRVRAENGKEGWVLKRYTSTELPRTVVIDRLEKENLRLKAAAEKAVEQAREFEAENKELRNSLSGNQKELAAIQQQYSGLQADAGNVAELRSRYDEQSRQIEALTAAKEGLVRENQELREGSRLRWFTTGAGVMGGSVLFGFFAGRLQRRTRRAALLS
jgi:SH3 domain protein